MGSAEVPPDDVAATRPHMARVYDYMLGGTCNFPADRAVGDQIVAAMPDVRVGVRAQRAVLGRAVRYLTATAGIRQFLDIGSGLPTAENVHQIAQRGGPAARVAYVDNDPLVLAQAADLVLVPQWRPDTGTLSEHDHPVLRLACAALARKPGAIH